VFALFSALGVASGGGVWSVVAMGHVAKRRWKTKPGMEMGWYVVLDIGRDLDRKRRQKWHDGCAARAEAEAHRVPLVAELDAAARPGEALDCGVA
jgi:hypothetical protein